MMQMIFSVDMLNTKVVHNFLIFLFLKFHDFRPTSLGVIDFTSLLLAVACPLNRSECLYCLAYLNMEFNGNRDPDLSSGRDNYRCGGE